MTALQGNDPTATSTVHKETSHMTASRTRTAIAALALSACLLLVGVFAASASARWGWPVSFGTGQLNVPLGVAVDESGGEVYVGNVFFVGNDKYSSSLSLLSPPSPFGGAAVYSGVAVNPTNHEVYVVNAEAQSVQTYDPSTGAQVAPAIPVPGSANLFGAYTAVQIASDSAGNVYVPNAPNNEIQVFSESGGAPSGGVAATITGSGAEALSGPTGVAVDSSGHVWVADTGNNRIEEFAPGGTFVKEIASSGVHAVAVGPAGEVFASVYEGSLLHVRSHVLVYSPTGAQIDDFGLNILHQSEYETINAIAVDAARGLVYMADGGDNAIQRFATWGVATGHASNVSETGATLKGTVEIEPGSQPITSCQFEYGTTTSYGQTVPCEPATPYSSTIDVSAGVNGLTTGADYHYRIVATNAAGVRQVGEDQVFGAPSVDGESSSNVVISTATVEASINSFGLDTTCHVQYVDEEAFGSSGYESAVTVPCAREDLGSGFGGQRAEAKLTGLRIDTVYHYRFVATNAAVPTGVAGADQSFATFGINSFSLAILSFNEEAHSLETYTQAGGHPYEMTTSFSLNTTHIPGARANPTDANPRDVIAELPPGLIGDPQATPKCAPYNVAHADCSGAAQVGVLTVVTTGGHVTESPLYNVVPPEGVAAQIDARFNGFVTAHIDAEVRTGGDYGVTANSLYVSAAEGLTGATVTLWGVPADPRHDQERYCPVVEKINEKTPCSERGPLLPFLRNPTACAGAQPTTLRIDSWQEPGAFVHAGSEMPGMTGCEKLDFKPTISTVPDVHSADSPSGLKVELTVLQSEDPNGLGEADLKDATVTLPQGVTVNPAAADGLVGCSQAQIELHGPHPAKCPDASKIGGVEIDSPLLDHPLLGGVYAAQQGNGGPALGANPFGSLLAMYLAVDDPKTGVVVKLAGKVTADPTTGQLTTTFQENPQLPFEHVKIHLFGGEHAVLATPAQCGSYTTETTLTPWSAPQSGPAKVLLSPLQIGSGPGGAPCAPQGFAPSFTAGTAGNRAGGFASFALTLTRNDGEQRLSTVATKMPPGLAGMVSNVPLCDEADANAGTCPAASQIGHVVVQAGVGNQPITLPEAGKPQDPVYLTGPYNGGPFGLSIVVPAEAGPFDLDEGGRPVVVRAGIYVDPKTAQVTVVSAPMPSILQGIPVDVKTVHVEVDRSAFIFNPTSCDPMVVGGTIGSTQGATASVSSRFQAAECSGLPFKPSFSVVTRAKHSKTDGAYLHVTVKSRSGQANIGSVKVELPKQLPSRLSTLNLACTEEVFARNPAACPEGSRIGVATATTPVLPVPLTGPAYFVSHGGARFPELIIVLQGDGVTLELAGETFISSKGITSSTFPSVPDVPVTRFDLVLPAGPHSVLAGNGNFCTTPMTMPTIIKGQNGAVIKQRTKVAVTGCRPAVTVLRKSVKGARATIVAKVPAAGELIATGEGLSQSTTKLVKAGVTTVAVSLSTQELQFLARHPGRRLRVQVKLIFKPSHGGRLSTTVSLLMG